MYKVIKIIVEDERSKGKYIMGISEEGEEQRLDCPRTWEARGVRPHLLSPSLAWGKIRLSPLSSEMGIAFANQKEL